MNHCKLSTDLVRRDWHILSYLIRVADDIEIRTRRLDHNDISTLFNIALYSPSGQTSTAGRQLIAFAITERRTRPRRVTERTVEAAGELGRIGHEDDFVRYAGFDELQFYGAYPAVVHVRRCHAVGACFRVCHGYIADAVDGEAVVETAVVAQDTAVAVGGVFAEADVGDDEEGGKAGAEETDGLNDWTLGVVRCGAEGIFDIRGHGDTEEDYGLQAFSYERFEVGDESVDATAVLVGKGGNEGLFFRLVGYEEGVDER